MGSVASSGVAESQPLWAEQVSRRLLEPLGARWRHALGVVERARVVGGALESGEADVLVEAAYLHDVGYAPELVETGFHAVDGARFVRACGRERLAGLVAYHSGAEAEAGERGLVSELEEFGNERSVPSRALT
jgi:HD superfamily phosphodiesterase